MDVTAPGATLALALVFLKSENASVAAQFRVPSTTYELHCVRPDLVALRVCARNLILWSSVSPTQAWLDEQLPPGTAAADDADDADAATGSGGADFSGAPPDEESLRLARLNSLAGACLALGLRFGGSAAQQPCDMLLEQCTQARATCLLRKRRRLRVCRPTSVRNPARAVNTDPTPAPLTNRHPTTC